MRDTAKRILNWYKENKRELPWRETKDPYLIWISEIMLQQTRVDQGLGYYLKFVKRFPDVKSLAQADENEVLNYWQGLGYYSRARNLHFSARYIVDALNGRFPNTYDDLLQLKGVGPYTASAIASIAFNLPHPVIDGNVMRVVSRLFGIDEPINTSIGLKKINENLNTIFVNDQPGDFNQAMMEFGALFCSPHNPDCENCIFNNDCVAFNLGKVNDIPQKLKAQAAKDWFIHYFVIYNEKKQTLLLRKRENSSIWKNLYDFPSIDSNLKMSSEQLRQSNEFKQLLKDHPPQLPKPLILKHQLSHRNVFANFFFIPIDGAILTNGNEGLIAVKLTKIKDYPISRLIDIYLNEFIEKELNASS